MNKLRLNISGSFEDAGWSTSFASYMVENINDSWTSKFGDARSDLNGLGVDDNDVVYRLMDTDLGLYYSLLRKNPVCSRGGFIQISIFAPKGKMPAKILDMLTTFKTISHFFDVDANRSKAFFSGDPESKDAFLKMAKAEMNKLADIDEPDIKGRPQIHLQNSKLAFRRFSSDKELQELFETPHQNFTSEYKSVYLVPEKFNVGGNAIELKNPIQKLYTIVNGKDLYYVMEGNQFDVPLKSNPDMNPKTLSVVADGKSGKCYSVNGLKINVEEGNVDFFRQVTIRVIFPSDLNPDSYPEKLDYSISGGNPKAICNYEKEKKSIVYSFEAHRDNNSFDIKDDDFIGHLNINPFKENEYKLNLSYKRRLVKVSFVIDMEEKEIIPKGAISFRPDGGGKEIKVQNEGSVFSAKLEENVKYQLVLDEKTGYLLKDSSAKNPKDWCDEKVKLVNPRIRVVVKLGKRNERLELACETNRINSNNKSFAGFPLKAEHNSLFMQAVQPFWRLISLIAVPVAIICLVGMLTFMFKYKAAVAVPQDSESAQLTVSKSSPQAILSDSVIAVDPTPRDTSTETSAVSSAEMPTNKESNK